MTQLCVIPNTVRRPLGRVVAMSWQAYKVPRHEFLAIATPEEEGGFSVFAVNIPGVVSQGETLEEARANIAEAFMGMLEVCRKRGESLPYSQRPIVGMNTEDHRLWITVDG